MHIDPVRTIHRHSFAQRFPQILSGMRLLQYNSDGEFSLTQFFHDIPQYAILSHACMTHLHIRVDHVRLSRLESLTSQLSVAYDTLSPVHTQWLAGPRRLCMPSRCPLHKPENLPWGQLGESAEIPKHFSSPSSRSQTVASSIANRIRRKSH